MTFMKSLNTDFAVSSVNVFSVTLGSSRNSSFLTRAFRSLKVAVNTASYEGFLFFSVIESYPQTKQDAQVPLHS